MRLVNDVSAGSLPVAVVPTCCLSNVDNYHDNKQTQMQRFNT